MRWDRDTLESLLTSLQQAEDIIHVHLELLQEQIDGTKPSWLGLSESHREALTQAVGYPRQMELPLTTDRRTGQPTPSPEQMSLPFPGLPSPS